MHPSTAQLQLRRHANPNQARTICTAALEHAPGSEQLLGLLRSCTPSPAHAAAEPAAATGTLTSASTGGGLGEAGAGASVNGSGAWDLVSAAAWEEGAAAQRKC